MFDPVDLGGGFLIVCPSFIVCVSMPVPRRSTFPPTAYCQRYPLSVLISSSFSFSDTTTITIFHNRTSHISHISHDTHHLVVRYALYQNHALAITLLSTYLLSVYLVPPESSRVPLPRRRDIYFCSLHKVPGSSYLITHCLPPASPMFHIHYADLSTYYIRPAVQHVP